MVLGRPALRAVALSDLTDVQALAYAQHRLKQLGVNRALSRAGARSGDLVHIGDFTFEYEPDTESGHLESLP
jgi:GTP-binding protein